MPIYISPLINGNEYLNMHLDIHYSLLEVYYQSVEGPLGFDYNDTSIEIFKTVVLDTIFYSEYNDEFLSDSDLQSTPNGIFIIPNKYVDNQIEIEKNRRLCAKKNILLKRYEKPLLQEPMSFFTHFYDKSEHKYSQYKIEELLDKGIEITISHSHDIPAW